MNKNDDVIKDDYMTQSLQPYQPVSLVTGSERPSENKDDGHLQFNKRNLLKQFTILFVIVLGLIFERVIYQWLIRYENTFMIDSQEYFNLQSLIQTDLGQMIKFNGNLIFDSAGAIHKNGVNIMFYTNIFYTLYVGFDALIAVKIMYMSYISVFLISYLQLLYSNPRPFWISEKLVTSICLPSFANPSSFFCQLGFTIFYTIHCYRVKNHLKSFKTYDRLFEKKMMLIYVVFTIFLIIYSFILFLMALQYMINTLLGALYASILYAFCTTFENQISNIVKHATIMNIDSKRYVFYISFILLILETLAVLSFQDNYELIDIDWVTNYMNCLYTNNTPLYDVPQQQIMGAKFTFQKTSVIFALIGGLFGVAHCFRHVKTLEWYKGPVKKRIMRVLVANIFTIPGWVFNEYLEEIALNHLIFQWGLSTFLMESLFFMAYYFVLFSFVPLVVFHYLKLNAISSTSYVVVTMDD